MTELEALCMRLREDTQKLREKWFPEVGSND
jgi:hypothetical protein